MTAALLCLFAQATAPTIQVKIDPRVELLTAVFRLIGADEFNMSGSESPYSQRMDAYLKPFKDHAAIKMTEQLREKVGIGFDSVPWLAVHIDGIRNPRMLPGAHKDDKSRLWKKSDLDKYLPLLGEFVRDTKFEEFLKSEEPYFAQATKSLENLLARKPVAHWLKDFYGAPPSAKSYAVVGLLCGGGNYGVSFRYANEEIAAMPVLGAGEFDKEGLPVFGEGDLGLILHEFSHPYINFEVAKFPEITKFGKPLFGLTKTSLAANAYGDAQAVMFETYTRAAENNILRRFAPDLAEANMIEHRSKGFLWESDIVDSLKEASLNRAPISERIRQTIPVLERLSKNPNQLLDRCPKIKNLRISKPDQDGVTVFQVEFDQPMNVASRGLSMSPQGYEIVKKSEFDVAGKVVQLLVKFKKGVKYDLTFNSFGRGYLSKTGYPMQMVKKTLKN